ncbi:hypothetical protein C6P45_001087 [Maudiozyma exigua]|uniref:DNA mismatch repair protein MutL n=1 Tax=Maudiozyma exigua TaxID=34358 RepID=A0A9P7B7N5_MAUEX|nr:hypothetical protein C6P45_001087 [Kazachstania exigua]
MATDTLIKAIDISDVNRITSGQVITDLISAVKELLDNSIDAGANQIDLIFQNYGIDSIECSDNGSGINEANFQTLTLKHYTSKLNEFNDIMNIVTLGFRGEALFSLCNISKLIITTTTHGPKANKIEYDKNGKILSNNITSRNTGTTIEVQEIFKNLPVRRRDFIKSAKNQFTKCITLLQSYAIIHEKIKFTIVNINSNNGRKNTILRTNKNEDMSKKILNVFGPTCLRGLIEINISLDLNEVHEQILKRENKLLRLMNNENSDDVLLLKESNNIIKVSGYISKSSVGIGHNSRDRQFIYINKRPITYPAINKCFNETFKSFNNETNVKHPIFFINFEINPNLIDINVTPDKRTVLLHNEDIIIDLLREGLIGFFESQDVSIVKSSTLQKRKIEDTDELGDIKELFDTRDEEDSKLNIIEQQDHKRPRRNSNKIIEIYTGKNSHDNSDDLINNDTELSSIMDINRSDLPSSQVVEDLFLDSEPISDKKESSVDDGLATSSTNEASDNNEPEAYSEIIEDQSQNDNSINRTKINLSDFKNPEYVEPEDSIVRTCNYDHCSGDESNNVVVMEIGDDIIQSQVKMTQSKGLIFIDDKRDNVQEDLPVGDDSVISDEDNDDDLVQVGKPMETNVRVPIPKFSEDLLSVRLKLQSICDEREKLFKKKTEIYGLDLNVNMDIENMKSNYNDVCNKLTEWEIIKSKDHDKNDNTGLEIDEDNNVQDIAKKLTLTINKNDFNEMNVVGQFNLGFIITTKENKKENKMDLFIIDQHASDEKYNFETLQKETIFKSQRLIVPEKLDLNVIDELTVLDNVEILEKMDEEPGSKIKLVSKRTSKNTTFGIDDLYELIGMIREHDGIRKDYIRCSKIRSMFAMRACRMSIMVGKPLNRKTMKSVVNNLSGLDKPWNCPHGRPTMKHLLELNEWDSFAEDYLL